jgi:hypothetical protein
MKKLSKLSMQFVTVLFRNHDANANTLVRDWNGLALQNQRRIDKQHIPSLAYFLQFIKILATSTYRRKGSKGMPTLN